jgi:hypothetical protein
VRRASGSLKSDPSDVQSARTRRVIAAHLVSICIQSIVELLFGSWQCPEQQFAHEGGNARKRRMVPQIFTEATFYGDSCAKVLN